MGFRHTALKVSFTLSKPLSPRYSKYCFVEISLCSVTVVTRRARFSLERLCSPSGIGGNTVKPVDGVCATCLVVNQVGSDALQIGTNPAVSCTVNFKSTRC